MMSDHRCELQFPFDAPGSRLVGSRKVRMTSTPPPFTRNELGATTATRLALCIVTITAILGTPTEAFQQVQRMIDQLNAQRAQRAQREPADDSRLNPMVDRDAESWLKRAEDAADRGDWKLAADTLSRVIDEYGDRTISCENGTRFISAARAARDALATWPADGLEAYRLLYDAEARQLMVQAIANHDLNGLRQIARKFSQTSIGPEAIDLLIDWLLDAGQGAESVDLLDQLRGLPNAKVPNWKNSIRLAIALALSDQYHRAMEVVQSLREEGRTANGQASKVPADWTDRVARVAHFVEQGPQPIAGESQGLRLVSWPQMLGLPAGGGRQPHIEPTVMPEDIWRDTLPGTQRLDLTLVQQVSMLTGRPPVWQCVSDGRNLYYSTPEGVEARDLATFDLLWRSVPKASPRDPMLTAFRVSVGTEEPNRDDRLDEQTTVALFHDYRGAISCGNGLVFCDEQLGTSGERFPTRRGVTDLNSGFAFSTQAEPNSIRAFEADTGRAVWTRGRGGPQDDELKFAHFYGPPIVSGERLLAVYQAGEDLNLAVLASDGTLVRKILLGSGRTGMFPMNGVLQPTIHDGTVFIPTGAGMLIALNAFDYSLRWLASYDRIDANRRRDAAVMMGSSRVFGQADEWVSSPPVIAGGFVVLAPHDSDKLLAFNRQSGELVWSYDRGPARYIVGTNAREIVIGGGMVASVDASTGNAIWIYSGAQPTGRPVICGDHVLVPTTLGLNRISLETGQEVGSTQFSRDPLGNLFALDGALYSISADSICKYVDVEQTRAAANLTLKKNPDDMTAVLRLAWLATMERKWNDALDLLDRADHLSSDQEGEEISSRIAHQRVDVLLNLAAETNISSRSEIIDRAAAAARRADDRTHAGLAKCDLLIEQKSLEPAVVRVLDLARIDGDEPVSLESHLDARTTVMIHDRILRAWREADGAMRRVLADRAADLVAEAINGGRIEEAVRIADALDVLGDRDPPPDLFACSSRIHAMLGAHFYASGDPESAVYFLKRAVDAAPVNSENVTAVLQLAATCLFPGPGLPASPSDADRALRTIPQNLMPLVIDGNSLGLGIAAAASTVGDAVSALEQRLPEGLKRDARRLPRIIANAATPLEIKRRDEVPVSIRLRDTATFFDLTTPPDPFAEILPVIKLSQILGIRTTTDSTDLAAWNSDLGPIVEDQPAVIRDWMNLDGRPAAIIGRVGVLAAGARICAVGLATGRMMWPSVFIEGDGSDLPQPPVVHVGGMAIIATHANTLVGIPARQGARPAWRREFPGRPFGQLAVVGDRVVAIDASAETLVVIHPGSGRVQRQFGLLVPSVKHVKEAQVQEALRDILKSAAGVTNASETNLASETVANHVAIAGGVVCRSGESRIVGRDIATGRTIWEHPFTDLISGIMRLDDLHFGISRGRHRMAIVRADTGAIVKDVHASGLQIPPLDAVFESPSPDDVSSGPRLLLFTRTSNDPPRFVLASFPVKDGESSWQQDLGPLATVSHRMMRASRDYVAAVAYEFPQDRQQRLLRPILGRTLPTLASARLFVFDKSSERRIVDSPLAFPVLSKPDDPVYTGLISDVAIFEDRIIAVGPDGYYVIGRAEDQSALRTGAR